jgi:site-specific DNA-methyltransferase (adenine-specific)
MTWKNKLYFGDNLDVLRDSIPSESVDLVYLDPPFNSKANYNVLFRTPKGLESSAQITAFEDSWHWTEQAEKEFGELVHQSNTDVSEMIQALRRFLGENDMMAYLTMMANRLLELHRVLKDTGSLYLHCDPTASHYLKIVLDGVFGKENYQSEITWKRTSGHNSAKRWGPIHDTIFFYSKSNIYTWNKVYEKYNEEYLTNFYKHSDDKGRYTLSDLTGSGTRSGDSGKEWRGVNPTNVGRHWAVPKQMLEELMPDIDADNLTTQEKLDLLDGLELIYFPPKGIAPRFKRYYDSDKGNPIQDVITDIDPISPHAIERLGYPTQKPQTLLERIIKASSNENDIVLDPFCGCGTAVHAAEKLKRRWIGIDITHLAITLIEKRVLNAFPDIEFDVEGTPKDFDSAQNLADRDKYQFQWWACSLVNAQPFQGKKKGADSGIDGLIYFQDERTTPKKIIVSVKGGNNVNVAMIRDLAHVVDRERASIGIFITMVDPTRPMKEEAIKAGYYESPIGANFPKVQILTIKGLLEGTERAKYPDLTQGGLTFKRAGIDTKTTQEKLF